MIDIVYYSDNIVETLKTLEILDYKKVIIVEEFSKIKNIEEFDNMIKKINTNLEIFSGLIFTEKNYKDLIRMNVNKRKKFDILLVRGGNLKLNREAVQNVFSDFLINPFENREDFGINHIFAKKAALNDIGIVIDFSSLKFKNLYEENKEYQKILEIAKLCRKYKVAFFVASFAKEKYDVKDFKFFEAFKYILGFEENEIKENWKRIEKILIENKKKRSNKWIMPGVELI
ncbi:MAG: RNase P subunit p30 family protein [Candidatus Aenigmatarchaeota archaeon]